MLGCNPALTVIGNDSYNIICSISVLKQEFAVQQFHDCS